MEGKRMLKRIERMDLRAFHGDALLHGEIPAKIVPTHAWAHDPKEIYQ